MSKTSSVEPTFILHASFFGLWILCTFEPFENPEEIFRISIEIFQCSLKAFLNVRLRFDMIHTRIGSSSKTDYATSKKQVQKCQKKTVDEFVIIFQTSKWTACRNSWPGSQEQPKHPLSLELDHQRFQFEKQHQKAQVNIYFKRIVAETLCLPTNFQ